MTKRQKHKAMKRPRSWHRRGRGPDWTNLKMQKKIDRALAPRDETEADS